MPGNGGTGDVGIQDPYGVFSAAHGGGQHRGDDGFPHAALTGNNADNMPDLGVLMGSFKGGCAASGGTVCTACGTVMGTIGVFFSHTLTVSFLLTI